MYEQEPCVRCSSVDIVSDTAAGDILCRNCGEIQVSRVIDNTAEWREFDDDDKGSGGSVARSSCTVERFGSSSTCFTGGLSEAARQALLKSQIISTDKRELKLNKIAEIISNIGSAMHLTRKILDCADHLCYRAVMENSTQAKRNELLAAAVVSLACRLEGYPRTLQEMSTATRLDVQTIHRVQSTLARELHIVTGRVRPQDLVARILCNPLIKMTDPVRIQYVKDICSKASEEGIFDGHTPQCTAAASIIFTAAIYSMLNKLKSKDDQNYCDKDKNKNEKNNCGEINSNCRVHKLNNKIDIKNINKSEISNDAKNDVKSDVKNDSKCDIKLNIMLAIESSSAVISGVKKAYSTLLLHFDSVIPQQLQKSIDLYVPACTDKSWALCLPTFDDLIKFQRQELLKKQKHKQIKLTTIQNEKNEKNEVKSSSSSIKTNSHFIISKQTIQKDEDINLVCMNNSENLNFNLSPQNNKNLISGMEPVLLIPDFNHKNIIFDESSPPKKILKNTETSLSVKCKIFEKTEKILIENNSKIKDEVEIKLLPLKFEITEIKNSKYDDIPGINKDDFEKNFIHRTNTDKKRFLEIEIEKSSIINHNNYDNRKLQKSCS